MHRLYLYIPLAIASIWFLYTRGSQIAHTNTLGTGPLIFLAFLAPVSALWLLILLIELTMTASKTPERFRRNSRRPYIYVPLFILSSLFLYVQGSQLLPDPTWPLFFLIYLLPVVALWFIVLLGDLLITIYNQRAQSKHDERSSPAVTAFLTEQASDQ